MYFYNVTACTSLSYQITFEWGGVHGVILKEKILQAYLYKKIIYTITATKKFKHIQWAQKKEVLWNLPHPLPSSL